MSRSITIAGVEITAEQVVSAVVKIDGHEMHIGEQEEPEKKMGFAAERHESEE